VNLPAALQSLIEAATADQVAATHGVSGGCISHTAQIDFKSGQRVFLKWCSDDDHLTGLFAEEARSLGVLAATRTVRVPAVLNTGKSGGYEWLLLEWLEPGVRTPANQRELGEQLAELHRSSNERYGWESSNFIGSLPQSNQWDRSWPAFWRTQRLEPQLRRAARHIASDARARFGLLLDDLPEILADIEDERPSLLHGDLWSGNVHMLADGAPAVIDPSCYYGHREVDIAMSRLFGGFSREFYDAYDAAWPHRAGVERRLRLYQLYYLLVHINLFGASYVAQTMSVLQQTGY
jgi:protein-ribulosamine 3-kinase